MNSNARTTVAALRSTLDIFPAENDGVRMFAVRDREDPDAQPFLLSEAALLLASLFDGRKTAGEASAALELRTGLRVDAGDVARLAEQLDEALVLNSDRYRRHVERLRSEFAALSSRPAIHAGGAYPGEQVELRAFLDDLFLHPDGPGAPPQAPRAGRLAAGVIAPHIDLHRGGPTYALTYAALAETEPADLYLLLGTSHVPLTSGLAATSKAYETPFGPAPTDPEFLEMLQRRLGLTLYEDELRHRAEHSLEFQALYLRYLERVGGSTNATVVPILCGSLQQWVGARQNPRDAAVVREAVEALRETIACIGKRVCVVAGADLAHVGPQFGDRSTVDREFAERVAREDAVMLEYICDGDAEAFYSQVMDDGDSRRICGLAPIYYLLELVRPSQGRLLKYSQWIDASGYGSVTYAGVMFET